MKGDQIMENVFVNESTPITIVPVVLHIISEDGNTYKYYLDDLRKIRTRKIVLSDVEKNILDESGFSIDELILRGENWLEKVKSNKTNNEMPLKIITSSNQLEK